MTATLSTLLAAERERVREACRDKIHELRGHRDITPAPVYEALSAALFELARLDLYTLPDEPSAFVAVPREPTHNMIVAGDDALDDCRDSAYSSNADGDRYEYETIKSDAPAIIYKAMLAAAEGKP